MSHWSPPLLSSPSPPMTATERRINTSRPVTPISPSSPLESEASGSTMSVFDSEESTSAACMLKKPFIIPSSWPPVIQACIDQDTDEARKHELIPNVRSEIVRVLSNAMFCYDANPRKDLCTQVAKLLVKKYRFIADVGKGVTGYES